MGQAEPLRFHSFAIGSLPLCQKPFRVKGIAMDRFANPGH
jgi:hypothetical protein